MVDLALFLHLLGALLFVAGIVLAGVAFEAARRRERPSEIALLLGLTRIGVVLVGIGALLLLAFGLWLVRLEHLSYGAGWISTSIVLYIVALGLGAVGGQSKHATSQPGLPSRALRQARGFARCSTIRSPSP